MLVMLFPEVREPELPCSGLVQKLHKRPFVKKGDIDAIADHRQGDQKRRDTGTDQRE
jgi:hypothetical protein